jgi:hypothetical protein
LWFQLSSEWEISEDADHWSSVVAAARARRQTPGPQDVRKILYDRAIEYLLAESLSAAAAVRHLPAAELSFHAVRLTRDVHARWLTTPREDLHGRSPRDILLEKREFIDFDLRSRCDQWRLTGKCPPGLARSSTAYQHAGFGTHEIVMYYRMIRMLLGAFWQQAGRREAMDPDRELARLERERDAWLVRPCQTIDQHWSPATMIHRERARLPLAVFGRSDAGDCDCALCRLADDSGPVFVQLDGSELDDAFAFSFHATYAQWQAEREERLAWARRHVTRDLRSWLHRAARCRPRDAQRSINPRDVPTFERSLLEIAAGLAELAAALRRSSQTVDCAEALNDQFGMLKEVFWHPSTELADVC